MDYKTISIADIHVSDRIRPVDEDHAKMIAISIKNEGLLNPITVRHTPNGKNGKYSLVAGAHRLKAVELNGETNIDAIIVKADKDEAVLLEVVENLFRNELSVIDRAMFVQTYRELWEAKYGTISRGGDQKSKGQLGPSIEEDNQKSKGKVYPLVDDQSFQLGQVDPIETEQETSTFSKHVADRIGLSQRSIKRLNQIAQNLNPELRNSLRNSDLADNQTQLLKLAKLEPSRQRQVAMAFKETNGDIKAALSLFEVKAKPSEDIVQAGLLAKAIDCIDKMSPQTYDKLVAYLNEQSESEVAA